MIDSVQFLGFDKKTGHVNFSKRPDWLVNEFGKTVIFFDKPNTLTIKTLNGSHIANIGDYIVKGIGGKLYLRAERSGE